MDIKNEILQSSFLLTNPNDDEDVANAKIDIIDDINNFQGKTIAQVREVPNIVIGPVLNN